MNNPLFILIFISYFFTFSHVEDKSLFRKKQVVKNDLLSLYIDGFKDSIDKGIYPVSIYTPCLEFLHKDRRITWYSGGFIETSMSHLSIEQIQFLIQNGDSLKLKIRCEGKDNYHPREDSKDRWGLLNQYLRYKTLIKESAALYTVKYTGGLPELYDDTTVEFQEILDRNHAIKLLLFNTKGEFIEVFNKGTVNEFKHHGKFYIDRSRKVIVSEYIDYYFDKGKFSIYKAHSVFKIKRNKLLLIERILNDKKYSLSGKSICQYKRKQTGKIR